MKTNAYMFLVGFLGLLLACDHPTKQDQAPAADSDSFSSSELAYGLYAFYLLDDKYAEEEDSLVIAEWQQEKEAQIRAREVEANIFDELGGGPNGAEWNPSTDLYLALSVPQSSQNQAVSLFANQQVIHFEQLDDSAIRWVMMPRETWEKSARPIQEDDFLGLYGANFMQKYAAGDTTTVADLDVGEIIHFELKVGDRLISRYFHATYGE